MRYKLIITSTTITKELPPMEELDLIEHVYTHKEEMDSEDIDIKVEIYE